MQHLFENTEQDSPLFYFEEISQIPRGSGNEKGISDYIKKWAEQRNIEVYQNEVNNLILKKQASHGYETHESVILQAHMDMVCEKEADSTHDFFKDPISMKIEEGWLKSADGTTLGADDGIGVAMILALFADHSLAHPALEAILTVEEESTFLGANNVDWSRLDGMRLIGLDHAGETDILSGSCGGSGIQVSLPIVSEEYTGDYKVYSLRVSGLVGGHSGEDIHRGRGSAIQILTRCLRSEKESIVCMAMNGGTSRLAISRDASAVFAVKKDVSNDVHKRLFALSECIKKEYESSGPNLRIAVQEEDCVGSIRGWSVETFDKALLLLTCLPNGIRQMNGAFPSVVESSCNLGRIETTQQIFTMTLEARGAFDSTVIDMKEKCSLLADTTGASCTFFDGYTAWNYEVGSKLRETAMRVYKDMYQTSMKPVIVHAGIECSAFKKERPQLDIISLGPNAVSFHSPHEKLHIESTRREWNFLKKLLSEL